MTVTSIPSNVVDDLFHCSCQLLQILVSIKGLDIVIGIQL